MNKYLHRRTVPPSINRLQQHP